MKVCPKCKTQYTDLSLRFCLQDGTKLTGRGSAAKTEEFNADDFSAAETVAIEAEPTVNETEVAEPRRDQPSVPTVVFEKTRVPRSGFVVGLLIGGLVIGAVTVIGGLIWFIPGYVEPEPKPKLVEKRLKIDQKKFKDVSSSSQRRSSGEITYSARNAFDGDDRTAWCEGVKGAGKGEWLRVDFESEKKLVELRIKPGYFKDMNVWKKNNRVASVSILFSDGSNKVYEFPDSANERVIDLPGIETDFVKITIRDVYPGSADSLDTLITDISMVSLEKVEVKD